MNAKLIVRLVWRGLVYAFALLLAISVLYSSLSGGSALDALFPITAAIRFIQALFG